MAYTIDTRGGGLNILQALYCLIMNYMKTCNSIAFYFLKKSFSDINRKCILPNKIRVAPALIIFGKIHVLQISQNDFFYEINQDGITNFHGIHGMAIV